MELILVEALKTILRPQVLIMIILCILMDVYYKKFIGMVGEFWVKRELKKVKLEFINNVIPYIRFISNEQNVVNI